jgi:methyl halide transferase
MTPRFDSEYWTERWNAGQTGWDIGHASTPLTAYIDTLTDQELRILIPGGGNGYEAEHLWKKGFRNVHLLDFAAPALDHFAARNPDFPAEQLHCTDFFTHEGTYDLVLEQTFYCALDPSLRDAYVAHMHSLLAPGGILAGVLFDFPLTEEGPPFGGSESEYRARFASGFEVLRLARCTNSIPPRAGRELFIELRRK